MMIHGMFFYKCEIEDLAKEVGIKKEDMDEFLYYFDNPSEWIHLLAESFKDKKAGENQNAS